MNDLYEYTESVKPAKVNNQQCQEPSLTELGFPKKFLAKAWNGIFGIGCLEGGCQPP